MKIGEIVIALVPGKDEQKEPRTLRRTSSKAWESAATHDQPTTAGLYAHEVKLAALIEEAIHRWGG